MINEHDMTKKMMEVIRSQKKNLLTEDFTETGADAPQAGFTNANPNVEDDTTNDAVELSGDERKAEEDKFRETIDSSTQITVFNVYPDANNVVFGGQIQGMGGIEFQFTLEDTNGFYITGNNIQITDEVARKITQMKGYYDNWKDEWFQKLATEYRGQ